MIKLQDVKTIKLSSIFQSFAGLESDYVIPVASASGMGI